MRWFACFAVPSTVSGGEEASKQVTAISSQKQPAHLALEKQDSAFLETSCHPTADESVAKPPLPTAEEAEEDLFDNRITAEYSIAESSQGRSAPFETFGAPKPSCQEERTANLDELELIDNLPDNSQIKQIMQLMCTVFDTESALVSLIGDERVNVHAVNFQTGDYPWRQSFCAHSLTPPNHQVMVIEDATKDARVKNMPMVKAGQLKFYAGTPIVSSKGHRLGTVCFAGSDSRKFDAEGCNMLVNMCELVTRELERDWANCLPQKSVKPQDAPQLIRAIECFNEAVIFIDVSIPKWRILHLNSAAQTKMKLFGVLPDFTQQPALWDLFEPTDGSWERFTEAATACHKFEVPYTRFIGTEGNPTLFKMTFRSAANDTVDSHAVKVGTPANIPSMLSNREYYFITINPVQMPLSQTSNSSLSFATGACDIDNVPFVGVELGPLLGKGGYGRVYRALRGNEVVAVKVINSTSNLRLIDGKPLEAVITRDAQHPNVLRTLDYATARSLPLSESGEERQDPSSSRNRRQDSETWMLLEFCDSGCLQEASDRGFFFKDDRPNLAAILPIARQVAAGMAFLHSKGVAHGDLTGGNVLLASSSDSPAGVTAKIADFGLSRSMDVKSKIETRTYGTVTHMPPELLERGIFSKAADTFALGVLMWEMYHGVRAWSSMNHAQIITAVAVNHKSLQFKHGAHEGYARLASALMSREPADRPTFDELVVALDRLIGKEPLTAGAV